MSHVVPAELIGACKELLRHLSHPARLSQNNLFNRLSARGRVSPDGAGLTELIDAALAELPPDQRAILSRCDLNGERHSTTAQALGLSRRQFYRLRASAFEFVTAFLLRSPEISLLRLTSDNRDALDLSLALSHSLEQIGDWRSAADYLEERTASEDAFDNRFWLEMRLADVYVSARRISQADAHLAQARSIGALSLTSSDVWEPVTRALEAKSVLELDRDNDATALLRDALPRLRRLHMSGVSRRVSEALISGLLVGNELDLGRGQLGDARQYAAEAASLFKAADVQNLSLSLQVRMTEALTRGFLTDEAKQSEVELLACYDEACAAGYVISAATISAHLGGFYRASNRPIESRDTLLRTLGPVRSRGPSFALATVLIELAATYLRLGMLAEAQCCIRDSMTSAVLSDGMTAVSRMLDALVHLAQGHHADALSLAEDAETIFARLRRPRLAGQTLLVQAKALAGMGQRHRAMRVLRAAIGILEAHGQPPFLADARDMLRRLMT